MGAGPASSGGSSDRFSGSWTYETKFDPEEFFRNVFGDRGFGKDFTENFSESRDGFGAAREVMELSVTCNLKF